jgi:hypothetical protein
MQSALELIHGSDRAGSRRRAGHDLGFKGKTKNEGLPDKLIEVFRRFLELS